MFKSIDEIFNDGLNYKNSGGVNMDVFVSDAIWLGGLHEARPHNPFVAIGPEDWEGEEELTFFKSEEEVNNFITKLRDASQKAFNTPQSE